MLNRGTGCVTPTDPSGSSTLIPPSRSMGTRAVESGVSSSSQRYDRLGIVLDCEYEWVWVSLRQVPSGEDE